MKKCILCNRKKDCKLSKCGCEKCYSAEEFIIFEDNDDDKDNDKDNDGDDV